MCLCPISSMQRTAIGGDVDKAQWQDLGDTWSGPHPERFKMCRWEEAIASSLAEETGDGDAWNANESTGWLGVAHDRL